MFVKGNKIYAEAGYYLKHKERNEVGFTIVGTDMSAYDEIPLSEPLIVEVSGGRIFLENRMFCITPKTMTYAGVKTKIITSRYSNDDQMALILNKDNSGEDLELFNKMQEWREWAGGVAKGATKGVKG